ncbi:MAG: hypothetical protein WAW09_08540 [Smithella sp.]|jgi:hypothetical protein
MVDKKLTDKKEITKLSTARREKEKKEYAEQEKTPDNEKGESPYFMKGGYLCRTKYPKEGDPIAVKLCNFSARITEENILDDGKETTHLFNIEGKLLDKIPLPKIEIPATGFSNLAWVSKWGSKPCLEPGQTVKDFVRHSIQKASDDVQVTTHFAHTGWREVNGAMVYLHAGGAVGCDERVSVKLSRELERYILPPYPHEDQASETARPDIERKGLETSLSFLDIGYRTVTVPLFCMIYLAPLTSLLNPMPNFSGYLFGQSGTFKTTAALLALCHFGKFGGAESLSNFDDTVGILEKRAFTLKDTLHCVDDYHPSANRKAAESKEGVAQRMIRGYSNRTARGRLNSDMTERGRYEPRGMMLMTAEEQPSLESTLARVCIIEVNEGALDRDMLTAIQKNADFLPYAMAAYIDWIRLNIAEIKEAFPARFRELRDRAATEGFHRKLPEQIAFLSFALETATSFLNEKGALSDHAAAALVSEGWGIFRHLAEKQQQRIKDDDPVALFFEIVSTLLLQSQARLECYPGYSGERIGAGEQIGWYDSACLYLLPTAIWHLVQRRCIAENTHFPFSKNVFFGMLKNQKIIMPSSSGQSAILVKIGSKPVRVLKIIEGGIYEKSVTSVTN